MKQESNIENKPLINDTKLFKEVSSVIGKVAALEELTKAYREYVSNKEHPVFDWSKPLIEAFEWESTPQGDIFWDDVYMEIPNE